MTMLPIHEDELRNPSQSEFLAMRKRLYEPPIARALAISRMQATVERPQHAVIVKARTKPDRVAEMLARTARKFKPIPMPVKHSTIVRKILVEVGLKHGCTVAEIVGPSRKRPFVNARQEAMYRLIVELAESYPRTGRWLGGRDHSTAFSGVRAHAKRKGLPVPDRAGAPRT